MLFCQDSGCIPADIVCLVPGIIRQSNGAFVGAYIPAWNP